MSKLNVFLGILVLVVLVLVAYYFSGNPLTGGDSESGSSSSISSMMSSSDGSEPVAAGRETACTDGRDSDGDNLADCDDPDCAGNPVCRCSALSCGEGGEEFSCLPAAGCICDDALGCTVCKSENQACNTTADCCMGLGYECSAVTKSDGSTEKRCMRPTNAHLCDITCEGNSDSNMTGRWGEVTNCGAKTIPPDTADCASLKGSCNLSPIAERNKQHCFRS